MKQKLLCEKCNKIYTEFLRKAFFDMHKGKGLDGCSYKTFLKRLSKFIETTTGNVNTVMYIEGMIEDMKCIEGKIRDMK